MLHVNKKRHFPNKIEQHIETLGNILYCLLQSSHHIGPSNHRIRYSYKKHLRQCAQQHFVRVIVVIGGKESIHPYSRLQTTFLVFSKICRFMNFIALRNNRNCLYSYTIPILYTLFLSVYLQNNNFSCLSN